MGEQQRKWAARLDIVRFMDQANERFVGMMQSLMRLVTWDHADSDHRDLPPADGPSAVAKDWPARKRGRAARRPSPVAPQVFAALAEQVERVLERRKSPRDDTNGLSEDGGLNADDDLARKLRDLFQGDASLRIAAAQWIRQRRSTGALSALESVLLIEEQHEVREEILRTIRELRPPNQRDWQKPFSGERWAR